LWRIRLDVNVVPVPPPICKINSKGTAVLNARHAGNRGKFKRRLQDYSGFGLKPQTPTPKSAQLASHAPKEKTKACIRQSASSTEQRRGLDSI
jgi:hypothetical protein